MAGPGAISSSIVLCQPEDLPQLVGMFVVVMAFHLLLLAHLPRRPLLFKLMGNTGINVVTRIMGLIMMSLGIEIMVAGIKGSLSRPDVSQVCLSEPVLVTGFYCFFC